MMEQIPMCRRLSLIVTRILRKEHKKDRKHNVYGIGVTGFEPTTPSSLTKCASQLRYTPIFNLKYLLFNRQMLLYMVTFRIARAFCNYF